MPVKFRGGGDRVDLQDFVAQNKLTPQQLKNLTEWLRQPVKPVRRIVGIEEFCLSKHYMAAKDVIWPVLMQSMIEIVEGGYDEVVATGGIGSGKTTLCLYLMAYCNVYLLSCMENPHKMFGLDPATEIATVFQSLSEKTASDVDYQRFKSMIDRSPYFKERFPYDRKLLSKMRFPNRLVVTPTATNIAGAIGQNCIGAYLDEINSMSIVEKSKRAGRGGDETYDQAKVLYDVIDRRRQSRFDAPERLPGILCMSSSKQYPGEFTDQKIAEAQREIDRFGRTTIYIYDKRVWEVQPTKYRDMPRFQFFIGDEFRKPRIIEEQDDPLLDEPKLIMDIPMSFITTFETDPYGAARDIAGVATSVLHPYIADIEAIAACFGRRTSILNYEECDFKARELEFYPQLFLHRKRQRWVHIDLGVVSDAAGVTCGYVSGFKGVSRGDVVEMLPKIEIDFTLRVPPPRGGEIQFFKLRELLYKLRKAGLPIKWVSFDSFQSVDSIQILRSKGFVTGNISMDKKTLPYDMTKTAMYDARLDMPKHAMCQKELSSLEFDVKHKKVDHPAHGSKDCADSLAGVVYGLTTRRETWLDFGIPPTQIPQSVAQAMASESDVDEEVKTHPRRPPQRER